MGAGSHRALVGSRPAQVDSLAEEDSPGNLVDTIKTTPLIAFSERIRTNSNDLLTDEVNANKIKWRPRTTT